MTDYQTLKVPELKKLLNERGLPQNGNKADLIARLQENDKEKSTEQPGAETTKPTGDEDLIDYDDDDFPPKSIAAPTKATDSMAKSDAAPAATKEPVTTPAVEPTTAAKATTNATQETTAETDSSAKTDPDAVKGDATAATDAAVADDKPAEAPQFTQNLPPTNAQSEAEKRAKRAERFGLVTSNEGDKEKESQEAKKLERTEKFGLTNEQVANLDTALPDGRSKRFNKRGRGRDDDDDRSSKRRPGGANGPQVGGHRNAPRNGQRQTERRGEGGGGGRNDNNNGAGSKRGAIDPIEKKKMEERAKRFAS